jgi:GxxExxY protein
MLLGDDRLNEITEKIIGCAFKVATVLGAGFLEKVNENALYHELRKAGLRVQQQHPIPVWYDGVLVGNFDVDLLVEGEILVELKMARGFDEMHFAQCINYLAATGLPICLLINFGRKVEVKRFMGKRRTERLDER